MIRAPCFNNTLAATKFAYLTCNQIKRESLKNERKKKKKK